MQELMLGMVILGWLQLISVSSGRNGVLFSAAWAGATTLLMFVSARGGETPFFLDLAQYFAAIWPVMMLTFWTGWVMGGILRPVLRVLKWAAAIR